MSHPNSDPDFTDLLIIGGGVNGCGIARDAVGRGLTVRLVEMNDLASGTSSASTKMFHGGLRYLEFFEIALVRHALAEREVLLQMMPHISWPMRFVLPYHKDMRFETNTPASKVLNLFMPWMKGRRPAWMIRFGLFLYDNLGGRKILPGTTTLDLQNHVEGAPLETRFKKAFEYSDCWVEDSRLVVLNAQDAQARGADIMVGTKLVSAKRTDGVWAVTLADQQTGETRNAHARMIVNAGGPWVGDILDQKIHIDSTEGVRLVRGSHIVTKRLYDHDKAYFLQGTDGRIIFAIPYEADFTLIGTTDEDHAVLSDRPECSPEEQKYLLDFANQYFRKDICADDIVWTYSGVRPLYDDGASSATAATRNYVLSVDDADGAPVLNVFGGKITTYRRLSEEVMDLVAKHFPKMGGHWTADSTLPGGDFPVDGVAELLARLVADHPFLDGVWARRLVRAYGTQSWDVLGGAVSSADLGQNFGINLTEREVIWLMGHEFAHCAEDVVWRRSKLGLRMTKDEIEVLEQWMQKRIASR
jgi:glycerol-3-phosphate dehydrogenase